MAAMGLLFFLLLFGVFVIVGIGGTILWIMAIIDCAKNEPSANDNNKVVWLLIIIFLHFVGAVLYYLVRRPQRIRELGR